MKTRGISMGIGRAIVIALAMVMVGGPQASAATRVSDAGNDSQTSFSPTAQAPTLAFSSLAQLGTQQIPIRVSWAAAAPDGAPLARYELERSVDAGPWTSVVLPDALAGSVNVKVPPWAVVVFRLRAVDTASVAGPWAESAPRWIAIAQESDPQVGLSAGWSIVGDSAAFGRRRATTTAAGETANFDFTGREVAWVARLGPNRGQASVFVDSGAPSTVDLHRADASSRRIVYRQAWPTVSSHTLHLATISAGAAVDVDAFLVMSDPRTGTLVGAGDIAVCSNTRDSRTASLVSGVLAADAYATAYTVGDNVYPEGSAQRFADCYEPSWGVFKARTHPTPGNHEYLNNPGAGPYFAYFGERAGVAGKGWYRYDAGTWRIYSLNSECRTSSSCYAAQFNWLKADLAAEPHQCVMAMWHRPIFSTGAHGSSSRMAAVFSLLYDSGAEVVITGHDHGYQRFAPADVSGTPDAARGLREFVVGTGGAGFYSWKTTSTALETRNNTTLGVLRLDLTPGAYSWQFMPVPAVGAFTDSGTATCH